jgi:bla regulator protein BlaR1
MNNLMQVGLANAAAVCILAIPAYAMSRWGKRPAVAHFLWVIVLIKLLTPPLWHIPVNWAEHGAPTAAAAENNQSSPPADPVQSPIPEPTNQILANDPPPVGRPPLDDVVANVPVQPLPVLEEAAPAPTAVPVATKDSWRSLLAASWITGSVVIALLTLCRTLAFARCLRRLRPAPAHIQEIIQSLGCKLGLRSTPVLSVAPMRMPPLVWGRGSRARIIVPARLWEGLDREQRETLLVHELAHLRRGDQWVRLLETVARTLYWWHPVVWIAAHELREAEEQCCDAWAVWALPGAAKSYARALVDTVDFLTQQGKPLPAGASGIGQVQDLKRRLIMIMRGTTPRKLSPLTAAGLVILGGAAVAFSPGLMQQGSTAESTVSDDPLRLVKALPADDQDLQAEVARLRQQEANLRQAMEALARSLDQTSSQLRDLQGEQPRSLRRPAAARPGRNELSVPAADPFGAAAPTTPSRTRSSNPLSAPQNDRATRVNPAIAAQVPPVPPLPRSNNASIPAAASRSRTSRERPVEERLGRLEEQMSQIAHAIEALRHDMGRERPQLERSRPMSDISVEPEVAPLPPTTNVPPISTPSRLARPAVPHPPASIAPPALARPEPNQPPVPGEDGTPLPPSAPPTGLQVDEAAPTILAPLPRSPRPARSMPSPSSQPTPAARPSVPTAPAIPHVPSPVEIPSEQPERGR